MEVKIKRTFKNDGTFFSVLLSRAVSFVTPPPDNSSPASFGFVVVIFLSVNQGRSASSLSHVCFSRHALHHLALRVFVFEPVDEQRSAFSSLPRSDDLHLTSVALELSVLTDQSRIVIVESAARRRLI